MGDYLHALLRDDERAKRAREQLAMRRFDLTTRLVARASAEDLLETIALFCADDALWARLADAGGTLTPAQADRLAGFDLGNLSLLLAAVGYTPPPPVDQLMKDASRAREIGLDYFWAHRAFDSEGLARTRMNLRASIWNARAKIAPPDNPEQPPDQLEAALRAASRIGRWLIPVAGAAAAGFLLEVPLAGLAGGHLAFLTFGPVRDALAKTVDIGADQLAALLARRANQPADINEPVDGIQPDADSETWKLDQILAGHRATVYELAVALDSPQLCGAPAVKQRAARELLLLGLRRHGARLQGLATDFGDDRRMPAGLHSRTADVLRAVEDVVVRADEVIEAGEEPCEDKVFAALVQAARVAVYQL